MKILFCGETFPVAPPMLRGLLPDEEILATPVEQVTGTRNDSRRHHPSYAPSGA